MVLKLAVGRRLGGVALFRTHDILFTRITKVRENRLLFLLIKVFEEPKDSVLISLQHVAVFESVSIHALEGEFFFDRFRFLTIAVYVVQ